MKQIRFRSIHTKRKNEKMFYAEVSIKADRDMTCREVIHALKSFMKFLKKFKGKGLAGMVNIEEDKTIDTL